MLSSKVQTSTTFNIDRSLQRLHHLQVSSPCRKHNLTTHISVTTTVTMTDMQTVTSTRMVILTDSKQLVV